MSQNLELADMKIAEVLNKWPETAKVFFRLNMACVGCEVSPFCSVADAADDYSYSLDLLLKELLAVIHNKD